MDASATVSLIVREADSISKLSDQLTQVRKQRAILRNTTIMITVPWWYDSVKGMELVLLMIILALGRDIVLKEITVTQNAAFTRM